MAKVREFEFLPPFRKKTVEDLAATLPAPPPKGTGEPDYALNCRLAREEMGVRIPHGFAQHGNSSQAADGPKLPEAVVITAAGSSVANGIYRVVITRQECGAQVYENLEPGSPLRLIRRAHRSQKTGKTRHGWVIDQGGTALYGVQSESLEVPEAGWKTFAGTMPVPLVEAKASLSGLLLAEAERFGAVGASTAEAGDWPAACAAFTAALTSLDRSGLRFGTAFECLAAQLLAGRAGARLACGDDSCAALRDALVALSLTPTASDVASSADEGAVASAEGTARVSAMVAEAFEALGCGDKQVLQMTLEAACRGEIVDQGVPLAFGVVDRWIQRHLAAHFSRRAALGLEQAQARENS